MALRISAQVLSSVIAAWSDVTTSIADAIPVVESGNGFSPLDSVRGVVQQLNIGYFWMLVNCLTSAAYVSGSSRLWQGAKTYWVIQVLSMRKRIKATGFSDWDSMFYNNLLSIPVLALFSFIVEDWSSANLVRNL